MIYKKLSLALLLCVGVAASAMADEDTKEKDGIDFKLTPSYYSNSDGNRAIDINLRGVLGVHTAWLGLYRDRNNFQQTRTGYERRDDLGMVRSVLSAQAASGGFFGGSVNAEVGKETYALLGFGRTNLRDYYNLNFDPNDAITLGIGSRAIDKTELSLFHIWDDRLGTKQHVTHAVVRYKPTSSTRWTIDTSYKHGLSSSGNYVAGYMLSINYDFDNYFVRMARDQYVNFSDNAQLRLSIGYRF